MNPGSLDFLNQGGEMGQRMRSFDWRSTALGEPGHWPQSLKTIVRVMLDSRFAMWMSWGPQGTFFCNDAYLPTVGIKRDWVLGARSDKVWEEIWGDVGPRINHVLSRGEATYDESLQLFLRRSGYDEETFHTFSYSPVYDDENRVAGMLCVVVEDTERAIGERRLRLLRDLASRPTRESESVEAAGRQLLDVMATNRLDIPFAALYLADAPQRRTQLVGCTAAPTRGQLPAELNLAGDAPAPSPVARAIQTGDEQLIDDLDPHAIEIGGAWQEPVRQLLVIPLKGSGQSRPFGTLVMGVSTRRNLDDPYRGFLTLAAAQFASQLADTRARLDEHQRAEALAELDRAKNVFFGNVSHEFRTPLTLLLGPIDELLGRKSLPPDMVETLQMAQRNGMRLRKLVNSLLDFSRVEAGRVDAKYQTTDLAAYTADLASVFRSAVEQAGLRFVVRCENLPEPVYVDRDMWEKVVLNLLSNALKFTFDGRIEVTLAAEGQQVLLAVRDTGVGIDASALAHVFDRFHRVAGTRSRTQEGTGIGLALVQELARLHGGTVSVESQPGQGSCFTVAIPRGKDHLPADRVVAGATRAMTSADSISFVDDALRAGLPGQAGKAPVPAGNRARPDSASRDKILVVDDNADMRSYIQRLLEPYWDVTTAADGVQALQALEAQAHDLVVTDMMMPGLDGRGLIQHIRTAHATHTLPVIVLSAQAGEEARVAGLNQGADDYLVKPFATRELLARVEVQLLRARMRVVQGGLGSDAALWSGSRLDASNDSNGVVQPAG